MGEAFRDSDADARSILFGVGMAIFVVGVISLALILKHRFYLKGRWTFLKRALQGRAVSRDRLRIRREVLVRNPVGGDILDQVVTIDLSAHGMFLKMSQPLERTEKFDFTILSKEDDRNVRGTAQVVWVQKKWSPFKPTGMGCRFVFMTKDDEVKLHRILKEGR